MGKINIIFAFIILSIKINAQYNNYVMNPSFEEHDYCPDSTDATISRGFCKNWDTPSEGTSDYYNTCSFSPILSVPTNAAGYEVPHSGNAYVGIVIGYSDMVNFDSREYMQGILKNALIANKYYIFRCFISVADDTLANKFCIDNFGIFLSNSHIYYPGYAGTLPLVPYYQNPVGHVLNTRLGWQMIEGVFRATGGEKYITLGNFQNNTSTNLYDCNFNGFRWGDEGYTYIYIDDVAVYDTSEIDTMSICLGDSIKLDAAWVKQSGMYTKIIAGLPTHVFVVTVDCDTLDYDCKLALPDVFSPNADGLNDEWKPLIQTTCIDHISNYLLRIYDRWGVLIFTAYDKQATWQGINNQIGTYVYYLQYDEPSSTGELNTKILQGSVELIR